MLWHFYRLLIGQLLKDGYPVTILSSPQPPFREFEQMGCRFYPLEITRIISPWQDIRSLFRCIRYLRKTKPQVIHAHTPKGGLLAMIAGRIAGIQYRLYTCHGLAFETEKGLKRFVMILSERLTCRLAHQVLVVSPSVSKRMAELRIGKDAKKTILGDGTACGLDLTTFDQTHELEVQSRQIRESLKIPAQAIVIGFVGRLVPDKGIHLLVQAFSELYRENDRVRLLVIGELEPHRGTLPEETLRLLHEHDGIRYIGFTHGIERYYACMDLLALPTRREGFPYVLLEAAAMQKPAIATKVTGCVDAVVDGVTGILIEPDNAPALLEALRQLVNDPALRKRMGQTARKRIEEKFQAETYIRYHISLYDEKTRD